MRRAKPERRARGSGSETVTSLTAGGTGHSINIVGRSDTKRRARSTGADPSGRFVLRVDPDLHRQLRDSAGRSGLSLNEYCVRQLETGSGRAALDAGPAATVRRAVQIAGPDLVAVAAYGSWTRGEATPQSDVDVLLVVERSLPLRRELYRLWDREPVTWNGSPVEPHFAHLPAPEERVAGVWAEVALDGIVLLDTGLRLSARLVPVRHDIAEGRIVRRLSHGQPYWVVDQEP
jgi:hypothetical protein